MCQGFSNFYWVYLLIKLNIKIAHSVSCTPLLRRLNKEYSTTCFVLTLAPSGIVTWLRLLLFNRKPFSPSSMVTFWIYMYFCVLYTLFLDTIILFISFYAWICYFQSYRCCLLFSFCFGGSPSCILIVTIFRSGGYNFLVSLCYCTIF